MPTIPNSVTKNANYQVNIRCTSPELDLTANLPEQFSMATQSNWDSRLPSSVVDIAQNSVGSLTGQVLGGVPNAISEGLRQFTNFNRIAQSFSHQTWISSAPIQMSLTMLFDAFDNATEDVGEPIARLASLVQPYRGAGGQGHDDGSEHALLSAPGPSLYQPDLGRVSIRIGKFLYFHSVVLNGVQPTWDSKFDDLGVPIAAACDVTFSTINMPSREDVMKFFTINGRSDNTEYGVRYTEQDLITTRDAVQAAEQVPETEGTP